MSHFFVENVVVLSAGVSVLLTPGIRWQGAASTDCHNSAKTRRVNSASSIAFRHPPCDGRYSARRLVSQGFPMKDLDASAVGASDLVAPSLAATDPPAAGRWLSRLLSGLTLGCTVLAAMASQAEPLDTAAERYRPLMAEEIDHSLAGARALRDALIANNLERLNRPGSLRGSAGSAPRCSPAALPNSIARSMHGRTP